MRAVALPAPDTLEKRGYHAQAKTSHEERAGSYSQESDRPLREVPHAAVRSAGTTQSPASERVEIVARRATGNTPQQDSDQRKAELIAALLTLFVAMQKRGNASLSSVSGALLAYSFTEQERQSFIKALAEAYLWGQMWAYRRAFSNVGITLPVGKVNDLFTFTDAMTWATGQASGIFETYAELLGGLVDTLPQDTPVDEATTAIDDWLTQLTDWKPEQIANYTVGVGVNEGTRTAITDMLDALSNVGIDTSGIPDGLSADQVAVRVVPGESSSDFCSDWAGKSVSLAEADTLPYFPAHTGCIHSLEVYRI